MCSQRSSWPKMSTCVSKSVHSEPQGIGSILGTEFDQSKTVASLRRTLSADMSSKKWLAQHGFSPLKKIASSEEFSTVSASASASRPELENNERFNTWNSFQPKEKKQAELENSGQLDLWSSILSEKSSPLPATAPYVHPLVKRSRSLSQKSLEICTESLGSETGSDGFSSYSPSEASESEQEEREQETEVEEEKESQDVVVDNVDLGVVTYNSYATTKVPCRSFPPPLTSLSHPATALHMRSHRKNGRLVLEALPVPVPSRNYFHAHRQGGRLVLTFINSPYEEPADMIDDEAEAEAEAEEEEEEEEEVYNQEFEERDKIEQEDDAKVRNRGFVLEVKVTQQPPKLTTGVINVHRSALMNKLMGLTNMDPTWSPKLDKMAGIEDEPTPLPQSLPAAAPPRLARLIPTPTSSVVAASFNTYDYCWRRNKQTPVQSPPSPITKNYNSNKFLVSKNQKQFLEQEQTGLIMRGNKADYLVPVLRGCKEPRRSLLIREPCCIATS